MTVTCSRTGKEAIADLNRRTFASERVQSSLARLLHRGKFKQSIGPTHPVHSQ